MRLLMITAMTMLISGVAMSQARNAYADSVSIPSAGFVKYDPKTTAGVNDKIFSLLVANDSNTVIFLAFEDDTAAGRYYQINPFEVWGPKACNIDWFRVKARNSGSPIRYEVE